VAFFSDKTIHARLHADVNGDDLDQLIQDANAVYNYVHRQPGCDESQLRNWGEGKDIGPDRMTAAVGFLRGLGRIVELTEVDGVVAEAMSGEDEKPASKPRGRRSRSK
jgi:hypothetical protein